MSSNQKNLNVCYQRLKKTGNMETYMIMKIFGYTGIRVSELKYYTVEKYQGKQNQRNM